MKPQCKCKKFYLSLLFEKSFDSDTNHLSDVELRVTLTLAYCLSLKKLTLYLFNFKMVFFCLNFEIDYTFLHISLVKNNSQYKELSNLLSSKIQKGYIKGKRAIWSWSKSLKIRMKKKKDKLTSRDRPISQLYSTFLQLYCKPFFMN